MGDEFLKLGKEAQMKRSGYKTSYATDATCMQCHEDMSYDGGVRSNTWWEGQVGVRAILCSETCRETYDGENLSHIRETMEA